MLIVVLGETVLYERVVSEGALLHVHEAVQRALSLDAGETDRALFGLGMTGFKEQPGARATKVRSILEEYAGVIAGELSMSIDYAARRNGVGDEGEALLIGPGGSVPGIDQRLADSCGLDVRVITPRVALGDEGEDRELDNPALVVAVGLAERFEGGAWH